MRERETAFIESKVKSMEFYGTVFEHDDEIEIVRYAEKIKPHGTSDPNAQEIIAKLVPNMHVRTWLSTRGNDSKIFFGANTDYPLGYIDAGFYRLAADMLAQDIEPECVVSTTGKFYASGLDAELWFCELEIAQYDVWSTKNADVWTSKTGKMYHKDKACQHRADRHMRETDAVKLGKIPCAKCVK